MNHLLYIIYCINICVRHWHFSLPWELASSTSTMYCPILLSFPCLQDPGIELLRVGCTSLPWAQRGREWGQAHPRFLSVGIWSTHTHAHVIYTYHIIYIYIHIHIYIHIYISYIYTNTYIYIHIYIYIYIHIYIHIHIIYTYIYMYMHRGCVGSSQVCNGI